MSNWQPMETAPTGVRVLLLVTPYGWLRKHPCVAEYVAPMTEPADDYEDDSDVDIDSEGNAYWKSGWYEVSVAGEYYYTAIPAERTVIHGWAEIPPTEET